jgi:hypothetical protein
MLAGRPARFNSPGIAGAFASAHPGAKPVYMGRSPLPPTMEQIRDIANQGEPPRLSVLHLEDLDPLKEAAQHEAAQGPHAHLGGWR